MRKELMLRLRFRSIESALMVLLAVGAMGFNDCCGDPNHNLPPGTEGADCRAYDSGYPTPNACDPGLYCGPTHNSYGCAKCPCDTSPGLCAEWCKGLPPGTLGAPCRATDAGPTSNACDPGLHCAPILGVCQTCACWRYDPLPPTCYVWCKVDARVETSVPKGDVGKPDVAKPDLAKPKPDVAKPDVPKPDAPKADTCAGKICYGACVDTTTDPANCGTCGTACKAGYQQCTNSTCTVGCASSTGVIQVFTGGMYGCAATVTWANRATLCTAGYHVCSAAEWIAKRGTIAPSASYWTSDDLKYNGSSFVGCYASLTTGTACTAGRPMRVCMGASDPKGNTCQYFGCGLNTPTPNQYFGGCNNDPTAGALCCK